jgi:hypothetical protein
VNAMTKPGLGNMYVHGWQLKQLIDEATVKFGVPQSQSMQYFVFDEEDEYKEDHAYSMISTLLGEVQYTGDYSGYAPDKHFCRVFDLFVVYEYEAPVKDVTKRFT